ncbi:MAG: precorrin-2 C(20)-methyltransferase [Halanaerobiales bacterium]|nr:precorrin-2 C(20)-methyltransferase [Halanaerobiales bacterium]
MKGIFYGIGVGPGYQGLLTMQGYQILQKVNVIVLPVKKAGMKSIAYEIVKDYIPTDAQILEQVYPMSYSSEVLDQAWKENTAEIAKYLDKGDEVAFLTLGDAFVFSTYSYIHQLLSKQGYNAETISGITSFQAASAKAGIPLVQGNEKLAVLPGTEDLEELEQILKFFDTVVILKVNRVFEEIYAFLERKNLLTNSYMVSNLGLKEEKIYLDIPSLDTDETKLPYLTTLIIRRER